MSVISPPTPASIENDTQTPIDPYKDGAEIFFFYLKNQEGHAHFSAPASLLKLLGCSYSKLYSGRIKSFRDCFVQNNLKLPTPKHNQSEYQSGQTHSKTEKSHSQRETTFKARKPNASEETQPKRGNPFKASKPIQSEETQPKPAKLEIRFSGAHCALASC